jgi:hypothetical protein
MLESMTNLSSHPLEIYKPSSYLVTGLVKTVLRIRDILVTDLDADPRGPKTYGSRSGTRVYLHHSSKIKSHKEVMKQ